MIETTFITEPWSDAHHDSKIDKYAILKNKSTRFQFSGKLTASPGLNHEDFAHQGVQRRQSRHRLDLRQGGNRPAGIVRLGRMLVAVQTARSARGHRGPAKTSDWRRSHRHRM